jgi:hypothetical protein
MKSILEQMEQELELMTFEPEKKDIRMPSIDTDAIGRMKFPPKPAQYINKGEGSELDVRLTSINDAIEMAEKAFLRLESINDHLLGTKSGHTEKLSSVNNTPAKKPKLIEMTHRLEVLNSMIDKINGQISELERL